MKVISLSENLFMTLFFMRHSNSFACTSGYCAGSGSACAGLTDEGKEQTRAAAYRLARQAEDLTIFSGPLRRCVETAEIVADVLEIPDIKIEDALNERFYGEWEGQPAGEVLPRALNETPPGGESAEEVRKRVTEFIDGLNAKNSHYLLVSHPGIWKAIVTAYSIERQPWIKASDIFVLEIHNGVAYKH